MFQVVISVMFSMTGKMGQFGPDSTIRRWIPELSSGLSTHKLESLVVLSQAIIFLARGRWPRCAQGTHVLSLREQRRARG